MKDLIKFDREMNIPDGNNPAPISEEEKESIIKNVTQKAAHLEKTLRENKCEIHIKRGIQVPFNIRVVCLNQSDLINEQLLDLFE